MSQPRGASRLQRGMNKLLMRMGLPALFPRVCGEGRGGRGFRALTEPLACGGTSGAYAEKGPTAVDCCALATKRQITPTHQPTLTHRAEQVRIVTHTKPGATHCPQRECPLNVPRSKRPSECIRAGNRYRPRPYPSPSIDRRIVKGCTAKKKRHRHSSQSDQQARTPVGLSAAERNIDKN